MTKWSEGAARAGAQIAIRFRKALPELPATTSYTLAEIISAETHDLELLEALENLMHAVAEELTGLPKNVPKSHWAKQWDSAEAALRKAKGESR
jgi:hypothetical protein